MNWLFPASIASIVSTLTLSMLYFYLFLKDRDESLRIWAFAWLVYGIRYIFLLFIIIHGEQFILFLGYHLCAVLSGILLLMGTCVWLNRLVPRYWLGIGVLCSLWTVAAEAMGMNFFAVTFFPFSYLGLTYFWNAQMILTNRAFEGLGKRITGWTFVLWGIHKIDYPFLRPVAAFAPWGYLINSFLTLTVAIGIILMYFDRVRKKLSESEKRYQDILENIRLVFIMTDTKGNITYCNPYAEKISGWKQEEIIGKNCFANFIPDDRSGYVKSEFERSLQYGQTRDALVETEIITKSGERKTIDWNSIILFDPDGCTVGIATLGQDVTERKKIENERALLATAIEYAAEGVVVFDRRGVIHYVNPAMEGLSGYSRAEMLGESIEIFRSDKHPESFHQTIWNAIHSGAIWQGHRISMRKDGTLYEEETTISPVYNEAKEIVRFVSVSRDVTHEVQLERQLRHSQKMEAIGTLAGGIAHDFNNILQAVLGYSELAKLNVDESGAAYQYIQTVLSAVNRAKELVQQILTFSRRTEQERKPVRLQDVIQDAVKLLRGSLPSTIDIQSHIDSECESVLADPTQIHQIVVNLGTNAYHAMRDSGGTLEITFRREVLDRRKASTPIDLSPGPHARLTVRDTGSGMNRETLERIFDPFFTTKAAGEGSGMGLAIVHGIVKSHRGAITVTSDVGYGSTFDVYFPICPTESVADEEPLIDSRSSHGRESILLVDDEEAIVELGKQLLERFDYQVETHRNGTEALEAFRADPHRFDLLITDQTMPDMTGLQLIQNILKIRPDMPIILCTGFSDSVYESNYESLGISELMMKPYTNQQLVHTVRMILDRAEVS